MSESANERVCICWPGYSLHITITQGAILREFDL